MTARRVGVAVLLIATAFATLFAWRWKQRWDHGREPDIAITRWEFRDDRDWFGLITAAVRCGEQVFVADFQQKIRALDLARRRQLSSFALEAPPMGLAADCDRQLLYAVLPRTPGATGLSVVALELPSGNIIRRYRLPGVFARGAQFTSPNLLFLSAIVFPDGASPWRQGTPESFFAKSRIGLKLSLSTGSVESLLDPYEHECIGAGACAEVFMSATSGGFAVGQATSTKIGVYGRDGRLSRVIDVTSPGFQRTGRILPLNASAEPRVRWQGENTTIGGVFQFAQHIAVVHRRPKIEGDWALGRPLNFSVLMNIYTFDGLLVRDDVELPDLPLGQDGDGVFVIDYGERGRVGASPDIRLSKIHVR